eukprot:359551-Chlamydomonas_euryale.AAC.6
MHGVGCAGVTMSVRHWAASVGMVRLSSSASARGTAAAFQTHAGTRSWRRASSSHKRCTGTCTGKPRARCAAPSSSAVCAPTAADARASSCSVAKSVLAQLVC